MAVLGIADIAVVRLLAVFFDLPVRADLDRIQAAHLLADRLVEGIGFSQLFGQRERVGEGFPDEALVECAACGDEILPFGWAARDPFDLLGSGFLFGRSGGLDQKKFTVGHQRLGVKLAQGQHRRIGDFLEEFPVLREQVIIHQQLSGEAARARSGMPARGTGNVVGIRSGSDDPAVVATFGQFLLVVFAHIISGVVLRHWEVGFEEGVVGFEALAQVGAHRPPVIHLHIDIVPEAARPRRVVVSTPGPLQISGQGLFAGTGNE